MDAVMFGGAPITDKPAMIERVWTYVRRYYEGEASEGSLRAWAIAAVDDVWGDGPRVTRYVPMIALRSVRAQVLDSLAARRAAGEALPAAAARDLPAWN